MPNETSRQETLGGLLGNLKTRLTVVERRPHSMHYANFSYATVPDAGSLPPAAEAPPGSWYIDLAGNVLWENSTGVWVSHPVPAPGSEWPGGGGGGGGTGVPDTRRIDTALPLQGGGDLTVDRTISILNFASNSRGVVPASGGGTVNFLRADGTWAPIPATGDEVFVGPNDPGGTYELWFDSDANGGTGQLYARVGGAWVPASASGTNTGDEVIIQPNDPGTANTYELWVDSDASPAPPQTGAGALVGEMKMWAGSVTPSMYLLCDGTLKSRTTYAALFAAIGTTWGAGDGTTTFAVPDMRGRAPVGAGQGTGLTNRVLGSQFGAETMVLSEAMLPAHSHVMTHNHADNWTTAANVDHSHRVDLWSGGSDRSLAHLHYFSGGANYVVAQNFSGGGSAVATQPGSGTPTNLQTTDSAGAPDHLHATNGNTGGFNTNHQHIASTPTFTGNTSNAGSGAATPNVQPSIAVNYIIFTGVP